MILKGSQRAGGAQLAAHLLNEQDNEHVSVLELRGFVADDLHGALTEAQAVAKGTRCTQYLFSLSLNPPKDGVAGEQDFIHAADLVEQALKLDGQPRAIVIHEKEGRRHAHVVWSRIDADAMRAVQLSHFKTKLTALSRELYLNHGWSLPEGLRTHGGTSPLNFDLAQWQQAKRLGLDPREIKDVFREAWQQADGVKAFAAALEQRGYLLAKGDRRSLVALDVDGEVYSVPRFLGLRTKEVRDRLGDGDHLPSVDETRATISDRMTDKLRGFVAEVKARQRDELRPMQRRREEYRAQHRTERSRLADKQAERFAAESRERSAKLRSGLAGLWDRVSGKAATIRHENEADTIEALRRDRQQRDRLALDQMAERRALQDRLDKTRRRHIDERKALHRDTMRYLSMGHSPEPIRGFRAIAPPDPLPSRRRFSLDP